MTNMVGADPDELERVGIRIEKTGRRIGGVGVRLQRALQSAPWHGGNADRFRQEFSSVHARAIAEAAAFLDDAYETLKRNADEQRRASGTAGQSWFDRIRNWIDRRIGWIGGSFWYGWPFPGGMFPFWPGFPPIDKWPFWTPPWLPPRCPGLPWRPPDLWPFDDLKPWNPSDWWDEIIIGGGLVLGPWLPGAIKDLVPGAPHPSGPEKFPVDITPGEPEGSPPSPGDSPPTPPVRNGPNNFSQARLVDVADDYLGESRPHIRNGTTYGAPGQCIEWVRSWIKEAGGPVLPGGGDPFGALDQIGDRVDTPMPGDVFQRAIPGGAFNGSPHTAIVKSYNPATGEVTLIEGNFDLHGTVREYTYTPKELGRSGHEVRYYRLGQV